MFGTWVIHKRYGTNPWRFSFIKCAFLFFFATGVLLCFLATINHIFQQLFNAEYGKLCRYALSYVQDEQTAEDVVQETFVKIWESKQDLITEPHIRFYLVTAVRNNCISLLRKKKSSNEHYSDQLPEPDPEPFFIRAEQLQETDERKEQLRNLLNKLPPKCKEVFLLIKMQDMSYQQAADVLGISTKTVENHMGKALKLLREGVKVSAALFTGFFIIKQLSVIGVSFLQRVLN